MSLARSLRPPPLARPRCQALPRATGADRTAATAEALCDAAVRHRRAMLDLNTAVGLRIVP
ncbi:MAG: hypothetical protein ACKO9B_05255 [Planctomycetota bacterium]